MKLFPPKMEIEKQLARAFSIPLKQYDYPKED